MTNHTLSHANVVLNAMGRDVRLERSENGRLYVATKYGRKPAILNSNADALAQYHSPAVGGTMALATGQLVRWVRSLTRLPLKAWRHWTGESVKLCSPEVVDLLQRLEYDTYEACRCVLCRQWPMCGLDWWSLEGNVGPCCSFGACRDGRWK